MKLTYISLYSDRYILKFQIFSTYNNSNNRNKINSLQLTKKF